MNTIIIVVLLLAMIASLGLGLYHLLKTPDEREIGIWVVLFGFIFLSVKMDWIQPSNSVHPQKFNEAQQKRIDQENN